MPLVRKIIKHVSDADPEILTIESTDNAGNLVTLFPALYIYPRVGISGSASKTYDRFYLPHTPCIELKESFGTK